MIAFHHSAVKGAKPNGPSADQGIRSAFQTQRTGSPRSCHHRLSQSQTGSVWTLLHRARGALEQARSTTCRKRCAGSNVRFAKRQQVNGEAPSLFHPGSRCERAKKLARSLRPRHGSGHPPLPFDAEPAGTGPQEPARKRKPPGGAAFSGVCHRPVTAPRHVPPAEEPRGAARPRPRERRLRRPCCAARG
jgi:hypothetical protein